MVSGCVINPNLHELGVWIELKGREPAYFLTVHFLSVETMMNDLACTFFMKGENIFQLQPFPVIVCMSGKKKSLYGFIISFW